MFVRRIVVGSSAVVLAASPAVTPSQPPPAEPKKDANLCRPSELPIYPAPPSTLTKVQIEKTSAIEQSLLEPVGIVRLNVVSALQQIKDTSMNIGNAASESAKQYKFIVTYLREEDNEAQRIGATAMGTLTGFIFGLRGGIIKRLTYSLIGTGAMGAICYPEQANLYFGMAAGQGKLFANVVYNFVYGIKPGDPQAELKFPELSFPKNFSEFVDGVISIGKSAKNALMPASAAPETTPSEAKKE